MIIGLVGKKQSGKTTAAEISRKLGYIPLAFADAIKKTTSKIFNIPLAVMNDPVAKESMQLSIELNDKSIKDFLWALSASYVPMHPDTITEAVAKYKGPDMVYTPRQLLQVLGTDLVRDCVDENYWLESLASSIKPGGKYAIHDVRFQNEIEFIQKRFNGKVIVIERPGIDNIDSHISEQFQPTNYDFKINNNGSLVSFINEVKTMFALAEFNNESSFKR